MVNSLPGIVHHHGQLVGVQPIFSFYHKVRHRHSQLALHTALDPVIKPDQAVRGYRHPGGAGCGQLLLAPPAVAATASVRPQQCPGAVTAKQVTTGGQYGQGGGVGGAALALVQDGLVPVQAVVAQACKDEVGGAFFFAGGVQVLHPHQPGAAVMACVQVTGQGGYQRAEVERACRGGGKTPAVARAGIGVHALARV